MVADAMLVRQRRGEFVESGQTRVVEVAGVDRHFGNALTQVADDVHRAHRPRRANDVDLVSRSDLGAGGDHGVGRRRIGAGGSDDADAAVMDAADLGLDLSAELAAALDNRQKSAGRQLGEQLLHGRRVGAEIDDVVEARVRLRRDGIAARQDDRARPARQFVDDCRVDRRVAGHEQPAARLQRPPLDFGVGVLDAGPWLDQRQRRSRQVFGRGDQHRLALGRGDDPLVEQHIFLQPALEVVAEGGVGLVGRQPAIVGLYDEPFADLVAVDPRADLDDADDGLVAGNGRRVAGDVVGHLGQRPRVEAAQDAGLAAVLRELLQQFEIGEAQPDRLDPREHLMWAGAGDRLGGVEFEFVGTDQLDGAFRLGNVVHGGPLIPGLRALASAKPRRRSRLASSPRRV